MSNIQSMLLWLPVSPDDPVGDRAQQIQNVTAANGAILDFCFGEISLSDAFEIINHYGANVDEYRAGLDEDLRFLGA